MAYAVAYPFGIVRIILTMLLVRKIFSIDVDLEVRNVETSATTTERTGSIWFPCLGTRRAWWRKAGNHVSTQVANRQVSKEMERVGLIPDLLRRSPG
jgi:uncharacterized transporter YbjL